MGGPGLSFVIVGTPRSGTTLVQRLACETAGVVVGRETHFFTVFFPGRKTTYPLQGAALDAELAAYAAEPVVAARGIDSALLAGGVTGPIDHPVALMEALARVSVAADAPQDSVVLGEKTPGHLLWWPVLRSFRPTLRFIAVIRDPRAVVASAAEVPWGMPNPVLAATRWALDERELRRLEASAGPAVLTLRYEDVVAAPDAAREAIARHIGALGPRATPDRAALMAPGESWKADAIGPITDAGVDRWRATLAPATIRTVDTITASGRRWRGYPGIQDIDTPLRSVLRWGDSIRMARVAGRRFRLRRTILRLADDPAGGHALPSDP